VRVPLLGAGAALVADPRPAGDQRRCQEAGVGRQLQERRPVLAARQPGGVGPRLPELGQRPRHPVRDLRHRAERGVGGHRHVARDGRVRGGGDPALVARGRPGVLPRGEAVADPSGRRRRQRLPTVGMGRSATSRASSGPAFSNFSRARRKATARSGRAARARAAFCPWRASALARDSQSASSSPARRRGLAGRSPGE
jgi:hypothetical protein